MLTPQHLQAQDRFVESVLQFRLDALNFRPWGFQHLQIDQAVLAAGNFALISASGLMPDGLPFDLPSCDAAPAPKPIDSHLDPGATSLDVFLAVPHPRERGVNVSIPNSRTDSRYLAEVMMAPDDNSGGSEKPVRIAQKNFRLLFDGEPMQGMSVMRVARVERTSAGKLQLDSAFVPPLLDISASEHLMSNLRRLLEILSAKSTTLAANRRHKDGALADFTAADIANFWLLYTVNTYFPLLNHLFISRKGHPERLFTLITSLAGSLTTFSSKIQPRDLPAYNHDDLSACMTELDEKVRELLETVVKSNCISLPLKLVRPYIYAAALDDDKYLANTKMYLAISSDLKPGELIERTPREIKVCSADYIDKLVERAVQGVTLTHVVSPPNAIPVKLNYEYFSLNQSGQAWETVGRARNLAAHVPGDIRSPQLELIILLPQGS